MNLLLSCIGRRGYLADWFREHLAAGDRIVGTSNTRWTPGLHACDRAALMPDIESPDYVPALLELCVSEEINALLSLHDADVDAIANARERFLEIGVTPVVAAPFVSRVTLDKLETVRFLRDHSIPTPRTFATLAPVWAELGEGHLDYPLVVKPRRGISSRGVFVAHEPNQLRVFFAYEPDMLVQEYLGGQECSLDVLNDLEGRVISVVVKRKVLMRGGETDQAETIHHPIALELGERLGQSLGHVGPLDVDMFVDGDKVTILEINARFGAGYPASHLAGAEFPRKILAMLRGERVQADIGKYRAGVSMMKAYSILTSYAGDLSDLRSGSNTQPVET